MPFHPRRLLLAVALAATVFAFAAPAGFARNDPQPALKAKPTLGPARGESRPPGCRRAVSLGRQLARRWLRLLRARLLGLRATRRRAAAQLVRALRPGSAGCALQHEAGRLALLLRARACRDLPRPWTHGARAAFRQPGPGRQPGSVGLRRQTGRRASDRPQLIGRRPSLHSKRGADLLRPRDSRAGVPAGRGARRLRARRDRARRQDGALLRAGRRATGRCGSGSANGTASSPSRSCSRTARSRASSSSRRASPATRPVARRGADVRPAAQDPARARGGRRRGAAGRRRARPGRARGRARRGPALLYTIPTFQNPSGRTLSEERRRRLVELAREHDLLVSRTTRTGSSATRASRCPRCSSSPAGSGVIYSSSFSKTIAPGVRVGYFVLPEASSPRELEARACRRTSRPPCSARRRSTSSCSRGAFEPNLERVRGLLRERRDAMLDALDRELGGARDVEPARGRLLPLARPADVETRRAARARRGRRRHVRARARTSSRPAAGASARAAGVQLRLAGRDRRGRRRASPSLVPRRRGSS